MILVNKILILIIFINCGILFSQEPDTLAKLEIYETIQVDPTILEFKVRLIRTSDLWANWANGTFQFVFNDPTYVIDPGKLEIVRLYQSDLDYGVVPGGDLPPEDYIINPHIVDGRIGVAVVGPQSFENTKFVDTVINIETFQIRSLDGSTLPNRVKWLEPYRYYQASAYKIQSDSLVPPIAAWWAANDNIEMENPPYSVIYFVDDTSIDPDFILKFFSAKYLGAKKIWLEFETIQESRNKGFRIYRGILPYGSRDHNDVEYDHLVAAFDQPGPFQQEMIGLGTRNPGRYYEIRHDTVDIRGVEYCYRLTYVDYDDEEYILAHACVPVPHAVITFAQANPNPFSDDTELEYTVDDDCIVTCKVYDLLGKEVMELFSSKVHRKGTYNFTLQMPEYAMEGLYNVIFVAYPIDDPAIEISRASVKIQLVR